MTIHNCSTSGHKWHFIANRDLTEKDRLQKIDCEKPNKNLCTFCFTSYLMKCKALKADKCLPCALRAKADKKLAMRSGLNKSPSGWLELTLTAPGADQFGWDKEKCNHLPAIKCSGKIGCKVNEIEGAVFNGEMPKNFNRYMQAVRRLFGVQVQYGKVFEAQARDLLHIHGLLTGVPAWPLKRINKELRRLAKVHGLGGQISVKRVCGDSPRDTQRAVGYVGKYLTKGSKTLQTVNFRTGEIRLGGYRDFTQSRSFGDSLKTIRAKRLEHYRMVLIGAKAQVAESTAGADATATGAERALDIYKKSYTFLE